MAEVRGDCGESKPQTNRDRNLTAQGVAAETPSPPTSNYRMEENRPVRVDAGGFLLHEKCGEMQVFAGHIQLAATPQSPKPCTLSMIDSVLDGSNAALVSQLIMPYSGSSA
jgi:hypothetical protein